MIRFCSKIPVNSSHDNPITTKSLPKNNIIFKKIIKDGILLKPNDAMTVIAYLQYLYIIKS